MSKYKKKKWLLALIICVLMLCPAQTKAASKVKINKQSAVVLKNKTLQLKVKGTTKKVTWSSSNKAVVKVSKKGKVTAKKAGTAKVTAKVGKKKYRCKITVPDKTMKVCKDADNTLKAPNLKGSVKWTSSNKKKVVISKKGKIRVKKAGKVLITAKAGSKSYRIYLTVLNKKHSWKKVSEKKATCTEEGVIKYSCKYCKDVKSTQRAFEHGDYRGQRKLVADGQEKLIKNASNVIESPDGVKSNSLSKDDALNQGDKTKVVFIQGNYYMRCFTNT